MTESLTITCYNHNGTASFAFPITTVKRLPAELKAPGLLGNMIKKIQHNFAEDYKYSLRSKF